MKSNTVLVLTAAGLLLTAAYRSGILKPNLRFLVEVMPLTLAGIIFSTFLLLRGEKTIVSEGLSKGVSMAISFAPSLVPMFVVMGLATVFIDHHKEAVMDGIRGKHGITGCLVAALLVPGAMTSLPVIRTLWDQGARRVPLMLFLMVAPTISWQGLLFRAPMLGWHLTMIQWSVSLALAVFFALLAKIAS